MPVPDTVYMEDAMSETPAAEAAVETAVESAPTVTPADVAPADKPATFTQDDVNRIVTERLARERAKAGDVDALREQAAKAAEAEKRIAALEAELTKSKTVAKVASEAGITNPEDVRLFLTGQDEETLAAQAKRLAEILTVASTPNVVPGEGARSTSSAGSSMSDFLSALTASN